MDVTSVKDQVALRGKVIYRQRRADSGYNIGLHFDEQPVTWSRYEA